MKARPSLAGRALLAILLTLGFYGLALGIAGLLLLVIYAEVAWAHQFNVRITLFCLIGAIAILWSIFPRRERFVPPGPELTPDAQGQLWGEIGEVAARVGQPMPAEIYLIPQANAWVTERGGLLGLGGRRVMGLGLPLLQILTVGQLRAVLAHEFGHFYGGDTELGPWIYHTRDAIMRAVRNIGRGSLLQLPFYWYATLFLRVTQGISRRQEYVADELAVRTEGRDAFLSGLQAIYGADAAYQAYWQNELGPALGAGFRLPLSEGFARFITTPPVQDAMQQAVSEALAAGTDPYDSHPTLQQRITAIEALPVTEPIETLSAPAMPESPDARSPIPADLPAPARSAISLLLDLPTLEQQLLVTLIGTNRVATLVPLAWDKAGTAVWLPIWRTTVAQYASGLQGLTADALPEFLRSPGLLADEIRHQARPGQPPLDDEEVAQGVRSLGAIALAVALAGQGWALDAGPGAEVSLTHMGERVAPFTVVAALASGQISAGEWHARCWRLGIRGLGLVGAED
jgi:Zn-dependent protease with chaperone function